MKIKGLIGIVIIIFWCSLALGQTDLNLSQPNIPYALNYLNDFNEKLIGKKLEDGKLILIFKQHDNCFAAVYPACEGYTKIWKEVYGIKDNKIILEKTVEGKYKKKQEVVEVETGELEFEEK